MKNLKWLPVFFIFNIMFYGCSNSTNYCKKPINKWLNSNLNDMSSYEPVEFVRIDSNSYELYMPEISMQLFNIKNVAMRQSALINSTLLLKFPAESNILIEDLKTTQVKLNSICENLSFSQIVALKKQEAKVNSKITMLLNSYPNRKDMNFIEISVQNEATSNRIAIEFNELEKSLSSYNSSLGTFNSELNDGIFIFHSFRASNALGAIIITNCIFKLSFDKKMVDQCKKMGIE
jgi:hypothetical protein